LPIRLLALDLDGTLINDALQMAPRDEEAVKAAVAAGVHVVLATAVSYTHLTLPTICSV